MLSAVKMELAVAARKLDRTGEGTSLLCDAQSSVDIALRSVRDLSYLLHPSALDDLGLVAALESHLADCGRRYGIAVDFGHDGIDGRHDEETERALYRIVQEALTNIARHARARTARVRLSGDAATCHVVIEDDGVGFDVADAERPGRRRGLGLLGILERVSQLHGAVRIKSRDHGGTRIEVEVPNRDPIAAGEDMPDLESSLVAHSPGLVMGELRLLLGDDHTVLRQGLRKILEERRDWHVVAEAGNGRDAVRESLALNPDVAVLDIGMPLLNGIEATRQIARPRCAC
jgi:CheY-like chemotaxis protein